VIYDADRERRAPAMYCTNKACRWTTDPLLEKFRRRSN
jgi:hypothetical protein